MVMAVWLVTVAPICAASPAQAPMGGEPISTIEAPAVEAAKAALGERLFFEPKLSRDGTFTCASCHAFDAGGADRQPRPDGLDGRPLPFNSPTIFNAALNFRLNWRGNFRTLEAQNEAVLLDPRLMGVNWPNLLARLNADAEIRRAFTEVYGGLPDRARVLDALAAFQQTLVTPNARFDRYLRGERGAISPDEQEGYRLFKAYGCTACHQGANVGGNLFQQFGIFADPFAEAAAPSEADLGRFTVTGEESDRHVFRVPSLRNVAITAPYFHDGRTSSLAEAVEIMAQSQLGRAMPSEDIESIVKFLATLTGEFRGRSLAPRPEDAPRP